MENWPRKNPSPGEGTGKGRLKNTEDKDLTTGDHAATYCKRGFAVVHIPPGEKGPKHNGWNKPGGYFTDPEAARTYWKQHPADNLGVVLEPSNLASLDVDEEKYARLVTAELGIDLDGLRDTYPTVQGNPARFRVIFGLPPGVVLPAHKLTWPGQNGDAQTTVLELRAGPVQDVLPPSIHPCGATYQWITPLPDGDLPDLPAELLDLWQNWEQHKQSLADLCPWAPNRTPPPLTKRSASAQGDSVIAAFNAANGLPAILERHGYRRKGNRYLAPSSSSHVPGVTLLQDDALCFSHHASDPLNDGAAHDAFDVFRILEHAGDFRAAVKAAARLLGMDTPKAKGNGPDAAPPERDPPDMELPPIEAYGANPAAEIGEVSARYPRETQDTPELPTLPRIVITLDDLTIPPPSPHFLIDSYLPKDVWAFVGTGGTGKSTLWLMQCVHLILGRPLWDMEITEPGPVLYVTAEDGDERLKWRLFNIVNQMGLTQSERQQVADQFHIVNLVGTGRRLAALDKNGNIVITSLADQIAAEFQAIAPVLVTFDPMIKFGPGERMVNDGEDMLVNSAHRLKENLHCAPGYIHHVSKDVARNGIVDHHSGRGGSALGDGARAVYQLLTITPTLAENYPGVARYQDDVENYHLLAYHVTKLSDARRPPDPLILRRCGWLFDMVDMPTQREMETAAEADRRERARRNVDTIVTFLKERPDWKPSRKNLEDIHADVGLGRNELRTAVTQGLMYGTLIESERPPQEQRGAGKTFLAVGGVE